MFSQTFSVHRFLLVLSLAGIFFIVLSGNVRYTNSDAQLTLLTSQSILEQGSIRLNNYRFAVDKDQFSDGDWKMYNYQGGLYYFYPLGTPVLSTPFVAVARKLGMDMTIAADDAQLQLFISALLCLTIASLLYRLALRFTGEWNALAWTLLLFLGSTWMSTLGTALWSFGFETVFLLLVLTDMADAELHGKELPAVKTGLLLFLAWFCRPAALSFILVVLGWLLYRKQFRKAALMAGAWLLPFVVLVIFSLAVFDAVVPPYYNPFRWAGSDPEHGMFYRLMATLFSPSRGLFTFTPLLLLTFAGFLFRELRRSVLFLAAWAWIVLHLLMLSRHTGWWGGWCYGPRLATDVLPAFALLLFLLLPRLEMLGDRKWMRPAGAMVLVAALFGIYIHTFQGIYNKETYNWNDGPNVDEHTGFYAWNWRYPQFLASASMNDLKKNEFDWEKKIAFLSRELPQGQVLLAGKPDARLRYVFRGVNSRKEQYGNVTLFNNLVELNTSTHKTFYVLEENAALVSDQRYFRTVPLADTTSLGDFLQANESRTVLLAVKDEGSTALTDRTRAYLRNHGARIDSLKYRQGYALIVEKGRVIAESFDSGDGASIVHRRNGRPELALLSLGMGRGNKAVIRIGKRDFSPDLRGFNAVVLDDRDAVVDIAHFDTHRADRRAVHVLKVEVIK